MTVTLNGLNVIVILAIFILTYVGIIHSKVDKTLAAVVGATVAAIAIIGLGVSDSHDPTRTITEEGLIHFIDLEIITLIIGTLILVDIAQDSGIFHYMAIKILKASQGDPRRLLYYFGALTVVLSALVNNISAMMIIGALTLLACERLELDPKPYLVTELSMTTIGGIVTLISSVPNIIISQIFDIPFATFFIIGAPLGVLTMVISFAIFIPLFKIKKAADPELMALRVADFDEWSAVEDKQAFYRSVIILGGTIVGFIFSQQLGLSLAIIAIAGGLVMILTSGKKIELVLEKLDWQLVAFFLGLFVLINALDAVQLLDFIAVQLALVLPESAFLAATILLWVTAIVSGIVDNIVVAAAFGPILFTVAESQGYQPALIAWAAIFGANFGGGFTPIGAPSAVIGLALLYRKTGVKIGWGEFIKTQGLATIARLTVTTIYLGILLVLGVF